jgi:hypothetical protein
VALLSTPCSSQRSSNVRNNNPRTPWT